MIVWLVGLSGAGKTTIARQLAAQNPRAFVLDGDLVRQGLNSDLGFSADDRRENIRRLAEVAKLMHSARVLPIVSAITPLTELRDLARAIVGGRLFFEVFVDCPLAECERRDVKGLYAKARRGELKGLTGVDAPFERPATPALVLPTAEESVTASVERLRAALSMTEWAT